jgi:alkaline phosphatase
MKIKPGTFISIILWLLVLSIAFCLGIGGRDIITEIGKDKDGPKPRPKDVNVCRDEFKRPHDDDTCKVNPKHSPKNVIIMIADGGGFNHFKAADYYQCSRTPCQPFEDFPVRLSVSTYPSGGEYNAKVAWCSFDYVENGATDSAAAATAMATGVKTYNAGIGVDVNGSPVLNLLERAEQLGKVTGVVTSVPFSHATPAGFVVHNGDRNNYTQIAADMVNKSAADVIMGCGHPIYNHDGKPGTTPSYKYIDSAVWAGLKNGSVGGDADGDGLPDPWTLVQTRAEFQVLATGPTPKRVFGLTQVYETLQEKRSGDASPAPYQMPLIQTVPTLEEMTKAALNVLDDDSNGLFLMIEGGAVDWASHSNESGRLIEEMNDFNKSVKAVIHWVDKSSNWGETLLIITADHETGYLTGPASGQLPVGPVWNDLVGNGAGFLPTMEWHSGSHTNSLVPFFAKGRRAQSFNDSIEGYDAVRGPYIDNTVIAKVILSLWHTN